MARFRLKSEDILSPLNSDVSLNASQFSFGNLSGTPDCDEDLESPIHKYLNKKDSDIDSISGRRMKEDANALELTVNDFKKHSNINTDKEKKFKKSYDMLRLSMDELINNKASKSSILSPLSKDVETENFLEPENSDCRINTDHEDKISQNIRACKNAPTPELETYFKISSKKMERSKKNSFDPKEKNSSYKLKSNCVSKSSVKESKKVHFETESSTKLSDGNKTKSTRSSSKETAKPLELREIPLKNSKGKSGNESNDFEKKSCTKLLDGNKTKSTRRPSSSIQTKKNSEAGAMPPKRGKSGKESNDFEKQSLTKLSDSNITKRTKNASSSIRIAKPSGAKEMQLKNLKEKGENELNDFEKESRAKLPNANKTKSTKRLASSIQTIKISEAGKMPTKSLRGKNGAKDGRTIKEFKYKCQQKIKISNTAPTTENKSLSIEKTIQLAVGAEMSNIRSFLFDQKISMQKDLLDFQEKAKKQMEVSNYMFAVIDELLATNRKLISKCK